MKKLLSIMLCVAMLFSVLACGIFSTSAAAEVLAPSVTVITNEGSPVKAGTETYFTIKFDNFADIKGIDITVTAEKAQIKHVETIGLPEAVSDAEDENQNYVLSEDGTTLRYVDLNTAATAKIIFKATASETTTVNISGEYAKSGEELFDIDAATGVFEIKEEIVVNDVTTDTLEQPTDVTKFIPYGSVYKVVDGKYVYAEKKADGSFDTSDGDYQYSTFEFPDADTEITSFGVSQSDITNTNKYNTFFANYSALLTETSKHGTLIFEGDWLSLKEYYIKKGYTVQEIFAAIYKTYMDVNADGEYAYISLYAPDRNDASKKAQLNVYNVAQKSYLWKNEDAGLIEYGVKLHGVDYATYGQYGSVAYCVDGETLTFSHNVKAYEDPGFVLPTGDTMYYGVVTPATAQGTVNGEDLYSTKSIGSHTRLYAKNVYKVADIESIEVAAGCRIYVHFFKADGKWNKGSGWVDPGTHTLSKLANANGATYFRITLSSTVGGNDTQLPPADGMKFYVKQNRTDTFALQVGDTVAENVISPKLASGSVNGNDKLTVDTCVGENAKRLYTVNTYKTSNYEKVTFPSGTRVFVQYWNADGTYFGGSGWQTSGTFKLNQAAPLFKITYASSDDSAVPAADGLKLTMKSSLIEEAPEVPEEPAEPEVPTFTLKEGDTIDGTTVSPKLASGTVSALPLASCVEENANRLYTVNTYEALDYDTVVVGENCKVYVQFFNADGSYKGGSGWKTTNTYKISTLDNASGAKFFKITFATAADNAVPPVEGLKLNVKPELIG